MSKQNFKLLKIECFVNIRYSEVGIRAPERKRDKRYKITLECKKCGQKVEQLYSRNILIDIVENGKETMDWFTCYYPCKQRFYHNDILISAYFKIKKSNLWNVDHSWILDCRNRKNNNKEAIKALEEILKK